jgi:simple sugar transport system permease protein
VIVTIMLNYVAFYLGSAAANAGLLQAPGSTNPKSPPRADGDLPDLLGRSTTCTSLHLL